MKEIHKISHLNREFWESRKVLVTGHTGFKGSWLSLWLNQLEAEVTGLALAPESHLNLFDNLQLDQMLDHRLCDYHGERLSVAWRRPAVHQFGGFPGCPGYGRLSAAGGAQ